MLTRRTPLARRTPLRRANRKRRAAAFARNYGERGARVRELPCVRCGRGPWATRIEASHVVARGMGGVKGDRRDLVPMCSRCHREYGDAPIAGRAENAKRHWGIDLRAEADRLAQLMDEEGID